jgi:hypothetical protein
LGGIGPRLETYAKAVIDRPTCDSLAIKTDEIHALFYNPAINLKTL